MELTRATGSDTEYAKRLLDEYDLPADVDRKGVALFVGRVAGRRVGICGLEARGPHALVRSVAVAPGERSAGYGVALVEALLDRARERGVREVYLLTEGAVDFFAGLGFERTEREAVPETTRETAEFATICPDSATPLRRSIGVE